MHGYFWRHFQFLMVSLLLIVATANAWAAINDFDKPVLHPAIPLVDEDGRHVLDSGKPYSTRMSCGNGAGGGCHDIDAISSAYHFEMGREESNDLFGTYRGIPQLVSPGYFGGYNCMLKNNPQWLSKKTNASPAEFLDYGAPGLIKACAECHNGGGFAEKDRNNNSYTKMDAAAIAPYDGDYYDWLSSEGSNAAGNQLLKWNWQKSGVIEPDCLICHADFSQLKILPGSQLSTQADPIKEYSKLRKEKLIRAGFFRYSNTAILEFINLAPDSEQGKSLLNFSRQVAGEDYSLSLASNQQPKLNWDAAAFDSNKKVVIPMLRFPANDNCMLCHETSHERRGFYGYGAEAEHQNDENGQWIKNYRNDVHKGKTWTENGQTRSIENCNVCHSKQYFKETFRNVDLDADHNFLVGNSDQDVRKDLNYSPGPLSCEYCHNGSSMGGAPNPALPNSQKDNILDAHKALWLDKKYLIGYNDNATRNRVVTVHFDKLACQTCHIVGLAFNDQPIDIRYRFREAEDGLNKYIPYIPAIRYYWMDANNNRVISRLERLSVTAGVDKEPQSYEEVKSLKASFENLLKDKGYKNPNAQLILTESNDYLISHNTRLAKDSIPCGDCHDKRSNGQYTSAIIANSVIGSRKDRIVAQIGTSNAYSRLITEGIVKLDMPYYSVKTDGRVIDNAESILDETDINPFTSILKMNSHDIAAGKFRLESKLSAMQSMNLPSNDPALSLLANDVFVFNSKIAGNRVNKLSLALNLNIGNRVSVPGYQLNVSADPWTAFALSSSKKKARGKINKNNKISAGTVSSSLYSYSMQDKDKNPFNTISGNRFLIKIPYEGSSKDICKISVYETTSLGGNWITPLINMTKAKDIISVVSGTSANPGYVVAQLDRLPEMAVLVDLKKKKKGCK